MYGLPSWISSQASAVTQGKIVGSNTIRITQKPLNLATAVISWTDLNIEITVKVTDSHFIIV